MDQREAKVKMTLAMAALWRGVHMLGGGVMQRMFNQGAFGGSRRRSWRGNAPYPEQSQRQAMRRFRRARGGPGIYFNSRDGLYLPRGCERKIDFDTNCEWGQPSSLGGAK